jgi:hypothetical protein
MKQDEIFLLNPIQISEIKNVIDSAHVSTIVEPSGTMRTYYITMPGERSLMLAFGIIGKYYEYTIEIDDTVVAYMTIPVKSKKFTWTQSQIMDLFRCCSSKVIWQEEMFGFARSIAAKKSRSYS